MDANEGPGTDTDGSAGPLRRRGRATYLAHDNRPDHGLGMHFAFELVGAGLVEDELNLRLLTCREQVALGYEFRTVGRQAERPVVDFLAVVALNDGCALVRLDGE